MTVPEPTTGATGGVERTSVGAALAAWETKGPTSLTVALLADALYGARDALAAAAVPYPETAPTEGRLDVDERMWVLHYVEASPEADAATIEAVEHILVDRLARVRAEAEADRAAMERVRALLADWKHVADKFLAQANDLDASAPDRTYNLAAAGACASHADDLRRALDPADTPARDTQDGTGDTNKTPGGSECRCGERGRHNGSKARPQWDNERGDQA